MDILEILARKTEMGVTEIAHALGLHVATIHNILMTLASRHYLLNVNGRYRLGPGLAFLASSWNPVLALPSLAQPKLEDITRRTRDATVATALMGNRAVILAKTTGLDDVTVQCPQQIWPFPMQLATGRLLVAFLPETHWAIYINLHIKKNPDSGEESKWIEKHWQDELRHIRKQGICILRRAGTQAVAIGVPIYGPGGNVLAALGVSCPQFRSTSTHHLSMQTAVTDMARQLSEELGYQRPASKRNTTRK